MNLSEFIREIGYEAAAAQFGVKTRTVEAWARGERTPRKTQARKIVDNSPVTYEGIYGDPGENTA